MIEEKGLGNKKINRVNVSLSNDYSKKLNLLSTSCNMKPTTLAGLILERCLDDSLFIARLQKEFCLYPTYKVLPIQNDGQIVYQLLSERTDR